MKSTAEIRDEILALPADQRAQPFQELRLHLEPPHTSDAGALAAEAVRRAREADEGAATVEWSDVRARVQQKLGN